jgi:hypothetical protein
MKAAAEALGLAVFNGTAFTERVEKIVAKDGRRLTFVFKDGTESDMQWQRRKTDPYSIIGKEKRKGRNIPYSKIGKRKEAEPNAKRTDHTGEEAYSLGAECHAHSNKTHCGLREGEH